MPTFKLNGNTYSGSTNYASAIEYIEEDGNKTTVQDKISELNSNLEMQNEKLYEIQRGTRLVQDAISSGYKSAEVIFPTPFDTTPTSIVITAINGEELHASPDCHVGYVTTDRFYIYYKTNNSSDTKIIFNWIAIK